MLKVCIIGCGQHSERVHSPALRQCAVADKNIQLAACCDTQQSRAEMYRGLTGFARCYTNYTKMLEKENPDAVLLVVPVNVLAGIAGDLLERKIPLLLEKPPGACVEDTKFLIGLQKSKQTPHKVAFNRRSMPQIIQLKKLVSGSGQITNINYEMTRYNRFDSDFSTTAIHAIDAVRFLAGEDYAGLTFEYQAVQGSTAKNIYIKGHTQSGCRVQINIVVSGGVATENVSVNTFGQSFYACLPTGWEPALPLKLLHFNQDIKIGDYNLAALGSGQRFYQAGGFYNQAKDFFAALNAGDTKALQTDLADCLQAMQVAECIRLNKTEWPD